jgi:signal transduction histidine kinase
MLKCHFAHVLRFWNHSGSMTDKTILTSSEVGNVFLAALLYRMVSVIIVIFTLSMRPTLPSWMIEWFERVSYPLLVYSIIMLIFYEKTAKIIDRYPAVLYIDLMIAAGVIQIGGSWRSSYFGYTLTAIILFTIFKGRMGAYFSAIILTIAGIIKDPSGGLPSLEIFYIDDWDMRMGAALIYITAGLILGYFSTLLQKLEKLSVSEIERTRQLTSMEEKAKLALELHDGAKQMAMAMVIKMSSLAKKADALPGEIRDELRWFWRGLIYLQSELNQVVRALKSGGMDDRVECCVKTLVREEAKIVENMTGFSCNILFHNELPAAPIRVKDPLRRFLAEALMNAWKHSGKMNCVIEVGHVNGFIQVAIVDQGKGFTLSEQDDRMTTGLRSLRFRAKELAAGLRIETGRDSGCRVILTLPVESHAGS